MSERVLVCGSRGWTDVEAVSFVLSSIYKGWGVECVIHGAARGADECAAAWARIADVHEMPFPAAWWQYGRSAGPRRNQQMIDEGRPTKVIAFHDDLPASKGTRDMAMRAFRAMIPVTHCRHDGAGHLTIYPWKGWA